MKYDFSEDAKLREVLQQIITFEDINIEIVGCLIWVDGNTYDYKDTLKNIGFKWFREKKKWYFHTETFRKRMLMYGKEASNRKQELDRQHHTIPNQRPKDKHCGNVHNRLFRHG